MGTDDRPRAFVPDGFAVPRELVAEEFRLEPLGPQHNAGDYEAWTSSIEHIRATPGFEGRPWPDPEMTPEQNLADLQRHAEDFAQRSGFTYTVLDSDGGAIIGCVYIYPSDRTDGAADVRSWVRADRAGLDTAVHDAVSAWLEDAWPFTAVSYAPRTGG
jgi:RimJ/RimL family protein N-acetyltransferase